MSQYDSYSTPDPEPEPGQELTPAWEMRQPASPSPSVQATMNQMTERLQTVIDAAERAAEAIRYDAEEQARRHLAEAQSKADRMTAERVRLISELTDDLIRHAGQVRDHSEQMVRSLEDAITSVTGKLEQPGLSDAFDYGTFDSAGYEPPPLPPSGPSEPPVTAPPEPVDPEPSAAPEPVAYEGTASPLPPLPEPPEPPDLALEEEPADDGAEPEPGAEVPGTAEVSQEALLHATRLAVAGNDRESIARALEEEHGVDDADAVLDRVLGT